jgi:hypothetical protein
MHGEKTVVEASAIPKTIAMGVEYRAWHDNDIYIPWINRSCMFDVRLKYAICAFFEISVPVGYGKQIKFPLADVTSWHNDSLARGESETYKVMRVHFAFEGDEKEWSVASSVFNKLGKPVCDMPAQYIPP